MIDTDKYTGHDLAKGRVGSDYNIYDRKGNIIFDADDVGSNMATLNLLADAPLLLEFIQKIVKDWCKPNQCNQAFGKDVRHLMYEYGLITFNEETRRYEVIE